MYLIVSIPDLCTLAYFGRWVISANFQSESFRSLVVLTKSESDNVCFIICV